MNAERSARAVQLYRSGLRSNAIAAELRVSAWQVRRVLRSAGIELRRGRPRLPRCTVCGSKVSPPRQERA